LLDPMNAQTLHCQSCGAAVSNDAPTCAHCGARLATISCPSCFGMMFLGMKFCPHCGTPGVQWEPGDADLLCPACEIPMLRGAVGQNRLHECEKCFGIWLDTVTFEQICRDAEKQAAVLQSDCGLGPASAVKLETVRYRRCPACRDLMHRVNFAQCSGVVVDVCRSHGTWFDRAELQRIVGFVRSGGLDRARDRKKAELTAEVRRLKSASQEAHRGVPLEDPRPLQGELLSLVVGSAGGLLGRWLRR
jgi:Zn-finger nucleic acid-binding protein